MDGLSIRSLSSDNMSAEYEVVNPTGGKDETGLQIAGNGNEEDLKKDMEEVIQSVTSEQKVRNKPETMEESRPQTLNLVSPEKAETDITDAESKMSKPYLDEDCVLFHGVSYLGCASVNAPRSETEALKTIEILRSQNEPSRDEDEASKLIKVVLSVPNRADGVVRLLDSTGDGELCNFKVYKILFCVRGRDAEPEKDCFAFTEAHESSGIFQCHVFQCNMPEAVKKVLNSFELAFQSIPKVVEKASKLSENAPDSGSQMPRITEVSGVNPPNFDENLFCFNVTLEIRESDGKGSFAGVPWDKASSCFKLRKNVERQVLMTVTQTTNVELTIERCFGLLLTPGRNVRHSDMHLIDMDGLTIGPSSTDANSHTGQLFCVSGSWDPIHPHFTLLNEETLKGTRVFISVAVDLVVQEIQEPVRLLLETKARIFPQNEKFWHFGKKLLQQETFFLRLKEISDNRLSKKVYAIVSLESSTSRERRLAQFPVPETPGYTMGHGTMGRPMLSSVSRQDEEEDDDTDEPLLIGSDCSKHVLTNWDEILGKWKENFLQRPSGLKHLVSKGIPDALRGEVWQLLAGCHGNEDILEQYRILVPKDSPQENMIRRDIYRTFPSHDFFKEAGGTGQESLYKISKAYSLYDTEVGYCQGLSFLAAALLLHMPEEQAFSVLCKIMKEYQMRELFKNGFEELHLKFYQLERLIEDIIPDLCDHFKELSIDAHMYSSQWFLTLFTAKFQPSMVYRVVDLFLSEGELVIFKVALGLLKCCRQDLLTLDFEGILKYFRVSLPKKYRLEENIRLLMDTAVTTKVTLKMLKKFEKDHENLREKLLQKEPLTVLERDNHRLMDASIRLEAENDEFDEELVTMKIAMETELEKTMKHAGNLQRDLTMTVEELRTAREKLKEVLDENVRLSEETMQAKELCRREMERQELEISKKSATIMDSKTTTSQLSLRIEQIQNTHRDELEKLMNMGSDIIKNLPPTPAQQSEASDKETLTRQIHQLELDLAQTKLSKVESQCKVQELEHQLATAMKELQSSKTTWLHKTISNLTSSKHKDSSSQPPSLHSPTSPDEPSAHSSGSKLPGAFAGKLT